MDSLCTALAAFEAFAERTLPWMASFGALEDDDVRRNVIDGLAGAIVGAPAMPEDFE